MTVIKTKPDGDGKKKTFVIIEPITDHDNWQRKDHPTIKESEIGATTAVADGASLNTISPAALGKGEAMLRKREAMVAKREGAGISKREAEGTPPPVSKEEDEMMKEDFIPKYEVNGDKTGMIG